MDLSRFAQGLQIPCAEFSKGPAAQADIRPQNGRNIKQIS